jgi:hypothetical protein
VFTNDSNTLSFYKGLVASNNTTIQSSSDFLTHLYPSSRDWTVVSADLTPIKTSNLTVLNKKPETNYSFCCYYSNAAGTATTGPNCNTYLTPADSNWQRHTTIFTFSTALNATQRNNLLSSLTTTIGASTTQIVNRRGESYNSASATPKKEWYVYNGATDSKPTETIFLTVKDNSTSSQTSVQNLKALFQSNGSLTAAAFSNINATADGLLLSGTYNSSQGYASTASGNRIAGTPTLLLNQDGSRIELSGL